MSSKTIKLIILSSIFTGLITLGTIFKIHIGPVPIVLANMFVILSGALLGPKWGSISVLTYLALGAMGLPVFSGGGGIALFAGPTGGYLFGYLIGAFITGLIVKIANDNKLIIFSGLLFGVLAIYAIGVPWLKISTGMDWTTAFAKGFLPFLIIDIIKVIAAFGILFTIKKYLSDTFNLNNKTEETR